MNVKPEQVLKVLTGNYSFSQLGLSMMVTRLKDVYAKDPTPYTLGSCTKEVNAFLEKYGNIMPKDCAVLSQL